MGRIFLGSGGQMFVDQKVEEAWVLGILSRGTLDFEGSGGGGYWLAVQPFWVVC